MSLINRNIKMKNDVAIQEFLNSSTEGYSHLELLTGDASTRCYYRVFQSNSSSVLCVDDGLRNSDPGMYPFFNVHTLLEDAGVPVPGIRAVDSERGFILMEDLGNSHVEDAVLSMKGTEIISLYRDILDILASLQGIKGKGGPFSIGFNSEKLMFEFDFFIEHALVGYYNCSLSAKDVNELRKNFLSIARILDRPDLWVLNHRDYHSRNIMIHEGRPVIIDFQDARMGLPLYDLASLIRDSYVLLSDTQFGTLLDYYYSLSQARGIQRMERDEFDFFFDIQAFQRNIKALGTFGYQHVKGNSRYEKYIAPTLWYLNAYIERRPELKGAGRILKHYIHF